MDAGGDDDEPLRRAVARCAARGVGDHDPGGSLPRRPEAHQPRRKALLESIQAVSLLTIMEIVGPVLLLAV